MADYHCAWCMGDLTSGDASIGVKLPTEDGPRADLRWCLGCHRQDPVFRIAAEARTLPRNAVMILEDRRREWLRDQYGNEE